jgi:hypothetical protein
MLSNYTIKSTDRFLETLYPAITEEVAMLQSAMIGIHEVYKIEIVISFLKYHSLKSEWLKGNKKAVDIMTSGSLTILNLESLFQSGKDNLQFTDGLEAYIRLKLLM